MHHIFAFLSIVISIGAFVPYVKGTIHGKIRPHLVGWLIWTLLTALIFIAQLLNDGGVGAWATACISVLCLLAVILSFFKGDKSWNRFDMICMGLTLAAIPLWIVTGTALWSVIVLTFIEFLGFAAMTPKTWKDPESESLNYFFLSILKYILAAMALEIWTVETALYPLATTLMAVIFSSIIYYRRLKMRV